MVVVVVVVVVAVVNAVLLLLLGLACSPLRPRSRGKVHQTQHILLPVRGRHNVCTQTSPLCLPVQTAPAATARQPQMRDWKHSQWQLQHLLGRKCAAMLAAGRHNVCTQTSPLCLPVQTAPAATARQPQMRDWKHSQWQLQHLLGRKCAAMLAAGRHNVCTQTSPLCLPVQTAPAATARQPQMRVWKHSQWQLQHLLARKCAAMLAAGRHNACTQTSPRCLPVQTAPAATARQPQMRVWKHSQWQLQHLLARKCAAMLAAGRHNACTQTSPRCLPVQTAPAVTARQPQMRVWKHSQWQLQHLLARKCAAMLAAGRHNVCTQTSPRCLPVQTAPAATARQPQMRVWKHSQWQLQHLLARKCAAMLAAGRHNVCTQTSPLCLPVQTAPAATARQPQMRVWKHSQWQLQHLLGRKCAAMLAAGRHNACTQTSPRCLPVQTAPAATARQPQMRVWKHSQWQLQHLLARKCAAMLAAGRHNVCTQTNL